MSIDGGTHVDRIPHFQMLGDSQREQHAEELSTIKRKVHYELNAHAHSPCIPVKTRDDDLLLE